MEKRKITHFFFVKDKGEHTGVSDLLLLCVVFKEIERKKS